MDLCDDDSSPGADNVEISGSVTLDQGTAYINVTRTVNIPSSGSLTNTNGQIYIYANDCIFPYTSGDFTGVYIGGVVQDLGSGDIYITGRGGDHVFGYQSGVRMVLGAQISGNNVHITGYGGESAGSYNLGVQVADAGTLVASTNSVYISGYAGGTGYGQVGTEISGGATVTSGFALYIYGQGGMGTLSQNHGVSITDTGTTISGNDYGYIYGLAGGDSPSNFNCGVHTFGPSTITSSSATVYINGVGSSLASGDQNHGVLLRHGLTVSAPSITIDGQGGGTDTSSSNVGVFIEEQALADGDAIDIEGWGGTTNDEGHNIGVLVRNDGVVQGGADVVTVRGYGGAGSSLLGNRGVNTAFGGKI